MYYAHYCKRMENAVNHVQARPQTSTHYTQYTHYFPLLCQMRFMNRY